jgi:hypothetical protein
LRLHVRERYKHRRSLSGVRTTRQRINYAFLQIKHTSAAGEPVVKTALRAVRKVGHAHIAHLGTLHVQIPPQPL